MTRADDQALYEQLETLYALDPDQRRLFTLANILPRGAGAAPAALGPGRPVRRALRSRRGHPDARAVSVRRLRGAGRRVRCVLEPLLFYLLHRATATDLDPALADTLKVFVLDEAWRFLRDPTIRAYVTEALKTWRKKNACVLLATQSSEDLQRSELLRVAIESCPTRCFLANPHIDRAVYQELFHLNETEAARIATLVPRQQVLLKQPHVAKVLNLHGRSRRARALFSARAGALTARRPAGRRKEAVPMSRSESRMLALRRAAGRHVAAVAPLAAQSEPRPRDAARRPDDHVPRARPGPAPRQAALHDADRAAGRRGRRRGDLRGQGGLDRQRARRHWSR